MSQVYFNLSFDDIHPESSKDGNDCGGDRDEGVFNFFFKLWKICPSLKITLFVTPNWIDRANDSFPVRKLKQIFGFKYTNVWNGEPFLLTRHKDWCRWLNSIKNVEIALHGYSHHANSRFHSQEFQGMTYSACKRRLERSEGIFKASGLNYVRGFRPPGWGISDGLFRALGELKYDFVSLDSIPCKIDSLSRYKIEKYHGLVNVPQNWDIAHGTIAEALDIVEKHGLLMAKGHICDFYDGERIRNGLNDVTFENLCDLLKAIKSKVSFATMSEIKEAMC